MARNMERLTALAVSRVKKPGYYHDGGGLYLHITVSGVRSWVYRYMLNGKAREMGLGPLPDTSLSEAREKARDARKRRWDGIDPIEHRKTARAQARLEAAKSITFKEYAESHMAAQGEGWSQNTHDAWEQTMRLYAYPVLGKLAVSMIDLTLILKVLRPLWDAKKTEQGDRTRRRIEAVLDAAAADGLREGDNPARWKGNLEHKLAAPTAVKPVVHRKSLPYDQLPEFTRKLRAREEISARALEFMILTASRPEPIRFCALPEFNKERTLWTAPAEHMKGKKREHRVPLSAPARALILKLEEKRSRQQEKRGGDLVFPAPSGMPMSDATMNKLLRESMGYPYDGHGFRATFDTWAQDCTTFPEEVRDRALAHVIKQGSIAAYRRGDQLEQRRLLMEAWGRYCDGLPAGNVVEISAGRAS
jgi:integrase